MFSSSSWSLPHLATRTGALSVRELENFFVPSLRNSTKMAELKKIHAHIVKFSLSQSNFLVTKMLDVCDSNGEVDYASLLFKQVVEPNVFLFNAMIRVYTHNDIYSLAVTLYKQMLRNQGARNPIFPDKFTFPFVVKSCAGLLCQDLVNNVVQEFVAGDDSKPFAKDVFAMLDLLASHENITSDMIEIAQEDKALQTNPHFAESYGNMANGWKEKGNVDIDVCYSNQSAYADSSLSLTGQEHSLRFRSNLNWVSDFCEEV
ncbi:hypothetical protein FEM48_Zijuj07G0043400 [Ziziphus jujuba var. spinosa]|uniref:Pentatricopeptide repeat-containing protein n=1 Tax=Ziziphus jujuba var. spinosa TaxID=714518 RepID=A0A978V2E8_ZIZJJ|nr:hypothetical protein FEM48_Zijuj07G0043400 [Ziziphus jujuba var. spinosa]